jgi:hypothetical protein
MKRYEALTAITTMAMAAVLPMGAVKAKPVSARNTAHPDRLACVVARLSSWRQLEGRMRFTSPRILRHLFVSASSFAVLILICAPTYAQWVNVPRTAIPRTPDGRPNLSAPVPRLPDGKPDLSGIWTAAARGKYVDDIAADLSPEDVPLQPWARTLYDQRKSGALFREDPPANCLPPGVPRIGATPLAWQVIQTSTFIAILYEVMGTFRHIFLDGREFAPMETIEPTWLGYSTGKWDGETLVVDTRGFNGKSWLDAAGKPSTDALHVIERFYRKDFGHMDIQITIDDPKAYTRPWTVTQSVNLLPDAVLVEFVCNENNFIGKN